MDDVKRFELEMKVLAEQVYENNPAYVALAKPYMKEPPPLTGWFYVSVVTAGQFVGGAVVEGTDEDDALKRVFSPLFGTPPSTEALVVPIPEGFLPDPSFRDRPLSKEDIKSFWPDASTLAEAIEDENERADAAPRNHESKITL
jgi:hypothetical protein